MTTLLTFLWSLLFIVPGIIASYRYALAPYLMAENPDMDVMEAILGMLFSVPVCAVLYSLYLEFMKNRTRHDTPLK